MKVTSVSFSDMEYRIIKWYAGKSGKNVSRLVAQVLLREADILAHRSQQDLEEWSKLLKEPVVEKEVMG